jgi:hypothetical protein
MDPNKVNNLINRGGGVVRAIKARYLAITNHQVSEFLRLGTKY